MIAIERFFWIFSKGKLNYLLSLAAASTSPFILDYLVIARGYSLALAFFVLAILFSSLEILDTDYFLARIKRPWKFAILSALCAISVAANLSFAFANTSVLVVFFFASLINDQAEERRFSFKRLSSKLLSLAIPGSLLFLLLNPAILNFNSRSIYFGLESWPKAFGSILNAVFDGFPVGKLKLLEIDLGLWLAKYLPQLFGLIVIVAAIVVLTSVVKRYSQKRFIDGNKQLWLFLSACLAVTLIFHSLALSLFGLLLPFERTGIFFVPLAIMLFSISINIFQEGAYQTALRYLGLLALLLTSVYFLSSFRVDYFRNREYDANSKDIYLALRSLEINRDSEIGINWLLEPSLNFYRVFYSDAYMPRFTRNEPYGQEDIFILLPDSSPEDGQFIVDNNIQIYFREDFSGAVIGMKE